MLFLGIRKLLVVGLVGGVFVPCNIWVVMNWLYDEGVIDGAKEVRKNT